MYFSRWHQHLPSGPEPSPPPRKYTLKSRFAKFSLHISEENVEWRGSERTRGLNNISAAWSDYLFDPGLVGRWQEAAWSAALKTSRAQKHVTRRKTAEGHQRAAVMWKTGNGLRQHGTLRPVAHASFSLASKYRNFIVSVTFDFSIEV